MQGRNAVELFIDTENYDNKEGLPKLALIKYEKQERENVGRHICWRSGKGLSSIMK